MISLPSMFYKQSFIDTKAGRFASALKAFLTKHAQTKNNIRERIIIQTSINRLQNVLPITCPIGQVKSLDSYLDATIVTSNFVGKVKPPLSSIPSFNVNALVLAFDGCDRDVSLLLRRLSRNSVRYLNSHEKILKSFVKPSPR